MCIPLVRPDIDLIVEFLMCLLTRVALTGFVIGACNYTPLYCRILCRKSFDQTRRRTEESPAPFRLISNYIEQSTAHSSLYSALPPRA